MSAIKQSHNDFLYHQISQISNNIQIELEGLVEDCKIFRKNLTVTTRLSKELFSNSDKLRILNTDVSAINSPPQSVNIWNKKFGSPY